MVFEQQLYWPVLDFGTLDSLVQNPVRRRGLLNYRKTVLEAVEGVDNAIGSYNARRNRLERLNEAVMADRRTWRWPRSNTTAA